jgi:hypothetical protein
MVGAANGGVIAAIYNGAIPTVANIRVSEPGDDDIEKSRKQAAWTSAGFLGFMFLLTRDRNSLLIGGLVLAAVDMMVKHANGYNTLTGVLHTGTDDQVRLSDDAAQVYPMANYAETDDSVA